MTDQNPVSRRQRIVVMSRFMAMASVAVAFGLPMLVVGHWLLSPAESLAASGGFAIETMTRMAFGDRLLGAAIMLFSIVPLCWAFMRLRACFAGFAAGELFAPRTVSGFREFGLGILASAILNIPVMAALSILASGGRHIAISFGSDTILMLCVSGTVAVVGWVLGEAAIIADENESFV